MATMSTGTTIGSTTLTMVKVKQERPDEAEIRELAAKMMEANKIKMAATQLTNGQQPIRQAVGGQFLAGGQTTILSYLSGRGVNQKPAQTATAATEKKAPLPEDKKAMDDDSQRGRFGWMTLGKAHIPYIIRQGEFYCAVRMVENKLLNKYLSYLHGDIYSCTCVRSYYITDPEARLLNEINVKHCEGQFGREHFTNKDLVVRLQDVREFYSFLDVCYNKLVRTANSCKDKCGFIRINGESVVPYTVKQGSMYVPLFYFEGETDSLKLKAEKLEGWDLAYLKFCCKVQGIRNELFASETCSVISLDDIKSYFPGETVFEDYWPPNVVDSSLLISSKNQNSSNPSWTKQPQGAVPASKPAVSLQRAPATHAPSVAATPVQHGTLPASVLNGWAANLMNGSQYQSMVSQHRMAQVQQSLQNSLASTNAGTYNPALRGRAAHNTAAPSSTYFYPQVPNLTINQAPPPLVRSGNPLPTMGSYNNAGAAGTSTLSMLHADAAARGGYQAALAKRLAPSAAKYNSSYTNDVIDLSAQQQLQRQAQMQAQAHSNGRAVSLHKDAGGGGGKKLIQISDMTTNNSLHTPYQVQKALVDNKMVPCINAKPYAYGELLMTLPDLTTHFFPTTPVDAVQKVLHDVLNVNLYKGNKGQMEILRQSGKCRSEADNLPLIQVRDVMQYMPQMKYVLEHNRVTEPVSKRLRSS